MSDFLENRGRHLDDADLAGLEQVLDELTEPELYESLTGRRPWPEWASGIGRQIDMFLRNGSP